MKDPADMSFASDWLMLISEFCFAFDWFTRGAFFRTNHKAYFNSEPLLDIFFGEVNWIATIEKLVVIASSISLQCLNLTTRVVSSVTLLILPFCNLIKVTFLYSRYYQETEKTT